MNPRRVGAKTRAARFLATAEKSGFLTAKAELTGKVCVKAGANPTYDGMALIYKDFCKQSGSPRPNTQALNLSRLKLFMTRAGVKTVGKIDKSVLFKTWFEGKEITESGKRTFFSAVGAAASIFNAQALEYYASRNIPVTNPFKGLKKEKPKAARYSPLSQEVRKAIWNDCQTEIASHDAMIVRMALGAGMRRSEIEAALPSWFTIQGETVKVHIHENQDFKPKNGTNAIISIPRQDYETLLKLRGKSSSPFFVPGESKKIGSGRLWERVKVVNTWLKSKGSTNAKPLHGLRKELGSILAEKEGIPKAAEYLRNTIAVCSEYYVGIQGSSTPNIEATFAAPVPPVDPEEAYATSKGMTVEELRAKLA